MTALDRYIRHADRWGTEAVFETATADLDVTELGQLAARLRHLDRKWHLGRDERDGLIVGLDQAAVPPKKIAAQIGVDVRTVRQVLDNANRASEPAFQSGENEQKRLPLTDDLSSLILSPSGA